MTSATLYREGLDLDELLAELDEEHPGRVRVVEVTYGRDGGVMGFFARRLVGVHYTLTDDEAPAGSFDQVDDGFAGFDAAAESPLETMLRAAEMVESGRVPDTAPPVAPSARTGTPTAENVEFARMLLDMASQKAAERATTRPAPLREDVEDVAALAPPVAPVAAPVAPVAAPPVAPMTPVAEPRARITDAELDELLARARRRPVGAHHHAEPIAAAPVPAPVVSGVAASVSDAAPSVPVAQIAQSLRGPRPTAPSAIEAAALAAAVAATRPAAVPEPVAPAPSAQPVPAFAPSSSFAPSAAFAPSAGFAPAASVQAAPVAAPVAAAVRELPEPAEPVRFPAFELHAPAAPAAAAPAPLPAPIEAPGLHAPDAPPADRTALTLRRQLVEIGVPVPWIPNHSASAYLVVEHLVNRVPIASDFDPEPGQIVVVAGPATHALAEATRLCTRLRIAPSEIRTAGCGDDPITHRRQAASLAREIRENASAPCIVAVATDSTASAADATGHTDLAWAAGVIAALEADHTVVVVDATSKESDLRATLRAMPGASALAVVRGAATASPAALWGLGVPVSSLDGRPATRGGWAALLIDRLAELDGA